MKGNVYAFASLLIASDNIDLLSPPPSLVVALLHMIHIIFLTCDYSASTILSLDYMNHSTIIMNRNCKPIPKFPKPHNRPTKPPIPFPPRCRPSLTYNAPSAPSPSIHPSHREADLQQISRPDSDMHSRLIPPCTMASVAACRLGWAVKESGWIGPGVGMGIDTSTGD